MQNGAAGSSRQRRSSLLHDCRGQGGRRRRTLDLSNPTATTRKEAAMIDASFEQTGQLKNGRPVWFRYVRPNDEGLLREGFARLSPASRYARFHTIVNELRDEVVHALTHVDGVNH